MRENRKKFVCQRADFLNREDFIKSLRSLRQSGGAKQKAAEKVTQIIGNCTLGADELFKLTNHGESRIDHCVKYDLPGACRLVTVQNENTIWFLFVGDHEEVDRWLDSHKGWTAAANKSDLKIRQTRVAVPQEETTELTQPGIITDENLPFLQRFQFREFEDLIPQSKLRRDLLGLREESDPIEILETVEIIPDVNVRNLIFDLIVSAKDGRYQEAKMRLKIYKGDADDVLRNPELMAAALASGANSDSLITFNDVPQEELERLLDEKFEDWMLFLHPEQKRIVDEDFDLPAVLKGVSGSGKTVVLIHRARRLAQKYSGEKIAVLTLNRTLAEVLRNLISRLCLNGEDKNIHVEAYYDYFQKVLNHLGAEDYILEYIETLPPNHPMIVALQDTLRYHQNLANEFSPRSRENLEDTWREYWRDELTKDLQTERIKTALADAIRGEFDAESYIRDEFNLVRSAFPQNTRTHHEHGYYGYERKGRTVNFPEKVRGMVISLLIRYEEYMFSGAMLDELGLGQALFPSIKKLASLPPELSRRCVLIDEFQDFSTLELRLLKQIPTQQENGLFLTGDTVQKVLVKDFNLAAAALDRNYVKTRTIKKNYRNSRQILQAADKLIQIYGDAAAHADSSIERLEPELAVRETAKPIALQSNFCIEAAWAAARDWIIEGSNFPWSVCLVTANPNLYPISKIIAKCPPSLKGGMLTGSYIEEKEKVSVGNLSDVKGLEFSLIIIVGCSAEAIPSGQFPDGEQWREAMRLYVAMTRGRDQVVLTYERDPSPFLLCMKDYLTWDQASVNETIPEIDGFPSLNIPAAQRVFVATRQTVDRQGPFTLSPSADALLRSYFQTRIYRKSGVMVGTNANAGFRSAYSRWRQPKNLDQIKAADLFSNRERRNDLAEEIDSELKRFGYALSWA